jgi:3-oxoacyl-[acyl-carrier-protein] synthase II
MSPEDIDHVNAHATSTPEGDGTELQALATLLGEHGPAVSISAQKSMLGHTLGAAGAIESIATIMAIREGAVPPTINLHDPDESVNGLDVTPNKATRRPIRAALNNSFGFGGQNAALVFTRFDG